MSKCSIRRSCSRIRRLLKRLDPEAVPETLECDGRAPCAQAVDIALAVHHAINPENVEIVSAAIQKLFDGALPIDRSTNALTQMLHRPAFLCPEIGLEIRQPCTVRSCAFWTDNTWTRNCIIYYLRDHDRDALELKDLTILLGDSTGSVRKRLNDLVVQIRRNAMLVKTQQAAQELPEPDELVCASCGKAIDQIPVVQGDRYYCSEDCVPERPAVELQLEAEFHLPIRRVLDICVGNFFALRPMCHALNVTTKQLQQLCETHQVDIQHLL